MCTNDSAETQPPSAAEIDRMLDFTEYDDLDVRCMNALRADRIGDMLELARIKVEDPWRLRRMSGIGKLSLLRINAALRQFRRNVNAGRVLPEYWREQATDLYAFAPIPTPLGTDYG